MNICVFICLYGYGSSFFHNVLFIYGLKNSPHLESIINICLTFLLHDPNYSYDAIDENDDDDDAKMDIIATDDDDDDAESDDFTDDDDVSWKVRRAAAKCLAAIISTRHDLLHDYYKVVSPVLISRCAFTIIFSCCLFIFRI